MNFRILLLLVCSSLLFTTTAQAAHTHHLRNYLVERQVSMAANSTATIDVQCSTGDLALSGSWRTDAVDQGTGTLASVKARASYGDSASAAKWHFIIVNSATGQAQAKVWINCLDHTTSATAAHSHTWSVTAQSSRSLTTSVNEVNGYNHTATCASGRLAVSPGFKASTNTVQLQAQYLNNALTQWHWTFTLNPAGANLVLTQRCLNLGTSVNATHSHRALATWRSVNATIAATGSVEKQAFCRDDEKTLLATFNAATPVASSPLSAIPVPLYLGMDPRGKGEAFRFLTPNSTSKTVSIGNVCFNDRTSE